ncbi:hypothetical protein C8F04DRAFT_1240299 [Mycena alexandri]|uniref:Uncharacterized protein n=1 Tax=Mycena alexandri TaxID=1745969 RepID=A0AAD6S960_9AGAR|nr:hypothetical protein C8F04DRAFT_1240299 [Mycena alexandri]
MALLRTVPSFHSHGCAFHIALGIRLASSYQVKLRIAGLNSLPHSELVLKLRSYPHSRAFGTPYSPPWSLELLTITCNTPSTTTCKPQQHLSSSSTRSLALLSIFPSPHLAILFRSLYFGYLEAAHPHLQHSQGFSVDTDIRCQRRSTLLNTVINMYQDLFYCISLEILNNHQALKSHAIFPQPPSPQRIFSVPPASSASDSIRAVYVVELFSHVKKKAPVEVDFSVLQGKVEAQFGTYIGAKIALNLVAK